MRYEWFIAILTCFSWCSHDVVVADEKPATQETHPDIKISLVSNTVYVGEMAQIKVVITAPGSGAVRIHPINLLIRRRALWPRLEGPSGTTINGFISGTGPIPGDFEILNPSEVVSGVFDVGVRPAEPGRYFVHVELQPTEDPRFLVRETLELNVVPIDPLSIVSTATAEVRVRSWGKKPIDLDGTVEVHTMKTEVGHKLLYHFRSSEVPADLSVATAWLWPVDENCKVLDIAVTQTNTNPFASEIWIIFQTAGTKYLGDETGSLLIISKISNDPVSWPPPPVSWPQPSAH